LEGGIVGVPVAVGEGVGCAIVVGDGDTLGEFRGGGGGRLGGGHGEDP